VSKTEVSIVPEALRDIERYEAERKPYWCGLFMDAPLHVVCPGGVSFAKYQDPKGADGQRVRHPGMVVLLTHQQVAEVRRGMSTTVLREVYSSPMRDPQPGEDVSNVPRQPVYGEFSTGWYDDDGKFVRSPYYYPQRTDIPLAKFCYMVQQPQRGHEVPPSMWDVEHAKPKKASKAKQDAPQPDDVVVEG
jgi:hypothetical protein